MFGCYNKQVSLRHLQLQLPVTAIKPTFSLPHIAGISGKIFKSLAVQHWIGVCIHSKRLVVILSFRTLRWVQIIFSTCRNAGIF